MNTHLRAFTRLILSTCLLALLALSVSVQQVQAVPSTGASFNYFYEDFNGASLDYSKWAVSYNGGTVQLANGFLGLSGGFGSSFPYVRTVVNPIPPTLCFSIRMGIQYTYVTGSGTGFAAMDMLPPNLGSAGTATTSFSIWQDSSSQLGYRVVSNQDFMLQKTAPHLDYHIVEYRWLEGSDVLYVDGGYVGAFDRDPSVPRPAGFWFGNYSLIPIKDNWTAFKVNFIETRQVACEQTIALPIMYYQGAPSTPAWVIPNSANDPDQNAFVPWQDDLYGNSGTMGRYGCNITSHAMVFNYLSWLKGGSSKVVADPGIMNEWLQNQPGGYTGNNLPDYPTIDRYAQDIYGIALKRQADIYASSPVEDQKLDNLLGFGIPVILKILMGTNSAGENNYHFVVAVGKKTDIYGSGSLTYPIYDPMYGYTDLSIYGGKYVSGRYYWPSYINKTSPNEIVYTVHSPIHLIVTDPLGRKLGYDPMTSTEWNEIPDAIYTDEGLNDPDGAPTENIKYLIINSPIPGQYKMEAIGYSEGGYSIEVQRTIANETRQSTVYSGQAQVGSVETENTNFLPGPYYLSLPLMVYP